MTNGTVEFAAPPMAMAAPAVNDIDARAALLNAPSPYAVLAKYNQLFNSLRAELGSDVESLTRLKSVIKHTHSLEDMVLRAVRNVK